MRARFAAIVVLALLLSGCMAMSIPLNMPPYVVMLTTSRPTSNRRCTGAALDERTVLTAWHCTDNMRRVVTVYGQATGVVTWMAWPEHDFAIMRTVQDLALPEYATWGDLDALRPATVWGTCPMYFTVTPRLVVYSGPWFTNFDGALRSADQWYMLNPNQGICGGDSGAALLQANGIVGVLSAVNRSPSDSNDGMKLYAVPVETVRTLIEAHEAAEQQPRPSDFGQSITCAREVC